MTVWDFTSTLLENTQFVQPFVFQETWTRSPVFTDPGGRTGQGSSEHREIDIPGQLQRQQCPQGP